MKYISEDGIIYDNTAEDVLSDIEEPSDEISIEDVRPLIFRNITELSDEIIYDTTKDESSIGDVRQDLTKIFVKNSDKDYFKRKSLSLALKYPNDIESLELCKCLDKEKFNFNFFYPNGLSPLMVAISTPSNNIDMIKLLIKSSAGVNLQNDDGETALMIVIKRVTSEYLCEYVKVLLGAGANLNIPNINGYTALMLTLQSQSNFRDFLLNTFIDYGANLYLTNNIGESVLDIAVGCGSISNLSTILEKVSRSSLKSTYGTNALIVACIEESPVEVIRILVGYGVDINSADASGKTPIMVANNQILVQELIDFGADINLTDSNGNNALMLSSCLEVANILIAAGLNVNLKNNYGCTALMLAITSNKIKFLISKGADTDSRNSKGQTALMIIKDTASISDLISAGANINIQDVDGKTALMLAVERKNVNICKNLINSGADIYLKDNYGYTALDLAVADTSRNNFLIASTIIDAGAKLDNFDSKEKFFFSCCKYIKDAPYIKYLKMLIDNDFDVNTKNSDGQTGLMIATNFHVVNFLLRHNIDIDQVDSTGKTALMIHIQKFKSESDLEIIQLLINAGCNINVVDKNNQHALMIACEASDKPKIKKCIKLLTKLNFDLILVDKFGCTCLKYIIKKSSDKKLIDLIKSLSSDS